MGVRPALESQILKYLPLAAALVTAAGLSTWRIQHEKSQLVHGGVRKAAVGTRWDPRGFAALERIQNLRESADFKERLRRGVNQSITWPGLQSAQVSWAWLELLQGIHVPASYEGDFSWMFSKLDTVISHSPKQEIQFVSGLAPFFLVMGQDFIGANLVMNELVKRDNRWNSWFWYGYHAMENLHNYRLAGNLFNKASTFSGAPPAAMGLAFRFDSGASEVGLTREEKRKLIESQIPEELQDKVKELRPELFKSE